MEAAMRMAVLSDVHGNAWALEAVLKDVRSRGIDTVVNLGDGLYGPLAPRRTADILRAEGILSIRGDTDRILLGTEPPGEQALTAAFVRSSLDRAGLIWLGSLPGTAELADKARFWHGRPGGDDRYLFERVTASGVGLRRRRALARDLLAVPQKLILCGHSHVFRTTVLPGGTTLVNPGSVGLQAFRSERPFPHVMASGSPHARYALVTAFPGGCEVQPVAVAYPWDLAAATALANGRPDWAFWLRTGRA